MLQLNDEAFTRGRSTFADALRGAGEGGAKIYVKVRPDRLPAPVTAQLDTGAPWTIFEREIVDAMEEVGDSSVTVELDTRFGLRNGRLARVMVEILADEGESLEVEATIFICDDWPAGSFIGYGGFLERIRFALDPARNHFYFGGY